MIAHLLYCLTNKTELRLLYCLLYYEKILMSRKNYEKSCTCDEFTPWFGKLYQILYRLNIYMSRKNDQFCNYVTNGYGHSIGKLKIL